MKQYYLCVFDELSHNSAKPLDVDNECVHSLPCSQFASLEELYIVQNLTNIMQGITQIAQRNTMIFYWQILFYRIVTGTCHLLVCKREYTNEIKHWFLIDFSLQVCFICNKFLTDLFWMATLLGSEQSSKCSSTKIAFYG